MIYQNGYYIGAIWSVFTRTLRDSENPKPILELSKTIYHPKMTVLESSPATEGLLLRLQREQHRKQWGIQRE